MSDMGSIRRAILEDWKLPDQTTPNVVTDQINRSICLALAELRPMSFWFNTQDFTFDTVADQQAYARNDNGGADANLLPWGFWSSADRFWHLDHEKLGGTVQSFDRLEGIDRGRFKEEDAATTQSGRSHYYTVVNRQVKLLPIPDSIDTVHGVALIDLGTPVPFYDSVATAWEFHLLEPDGTQVAATGVNTDTFSTAWMSEVAAQDVVLCKAASIYFRRFGRDPDMAAAAEQQYVIALRGLRTQQGAMNQTMGDLYPWMGE